MMQDFSFIHRYFLAEKQAGIFFLVAGGISAVLAVLFLFLMKSTPSFWKGMAIPLAVIGMLQLVVGYTVFARSDKQRMEVSYKAGMDPGFIKQAELPRMKKVQANFTVYKYAELILLAAGIVLILLYRTNADKDFWYGLGIALVIQCAISFGADIMAAKRGAVYLQGLEQRV